MQKKFEDSLSLSQEEYNNTRLSDYKNFFKKEVERLLDISIARNLQVLSNKNHQRRKDHVNVFI